MRKEIKSERNEGESLGYLQSSPEEKEMKDDYEVLKTYTLELMELIGCTRLVAYSLALIRVGYETGKWGNNT